MKGSLAIARFVMTHRLENSKSCQHFGQHKGENDLPVALPHGSMNKWNRSLRSVCAKYHSDPSPRDYIRYLHPAASGTTRAWIKEISTVAPTTPLLRAVAACSNSLYGFTHKFFSHWNGCSCLSFTSVSAHSLLQHQSVITPASGHELSLFVAITKARRRECDIIPKYV